MTGETGLATTHLLLKRMQPQNYRGLTTLVVHSCQARGAKALGTQLPAQTALPVTSDSSAATYTLSKEVYHARRQVLRGYTAAAALETRSPHSLGCKRGPMGARQASFICFIDQPIIRNWRRKGVILVSDTCFPYMATL